MSGTIRFYFDFASPYGYFAKFLVDDLGAKFGREVEWRPIMIGSAFKASGNRPLVDQPLKGAYSRHDWDRMARRMAVAFRLPEGFPSAALAPSRAYWWLEGQDKALAKSYAHAVYHAYFAESRPISDLAVAAEIGASLGVDPEALSAAVQDPVWKQRLKDETDAAIALGVFGSPFFMVDGEGFWGVDRLAMVEDWLRQGGW
ncbi:2-hydroxychromene-2-carboxylate isomerase [Candidatus Terasakiella magnetica]|nr:2-hydroxychromene-2-carboxylate isomerase [Candidatus Terasakiella magnetica]